jgi:flagellar biosynthesis protein FlhB
VADQDLDKSEAATPYKLEQARRRGQAAKSVDLTIGAVFLVLAGVFYASGEQMVQRELALCREVLGQLGRTDWSSDTAFTWLMGIAGHAVTALAPLLASVIITAALAGFLQAGGVFSAHPIKPDPQRVNPAAGFKRLFSARLLFDTAKSVAKVLVVGAVLWLALSVAIEAAPSLPYRTPRALLHWLHGNVGGVLVKLAAVLLLVGLVDFVYSRREFAKKMRMSQRELKDEFKQREGDPRIRGRQRELRAKMLKQARSSKHLPDADVLVTNPTHVAVALQYRHGDMPAPRLLTKGVGQQAAQLRERARRLGIPVVQNPPLARALYKQVDFSGYVPQDLYPDVAKILVWVFAMRSRQGAQPAGAAA